jgi:hypothetical protein
LANTLAYPAIGEKSFKHWSLDEAPVIDILNEPEKNIKIKKTLL